MSLVVINIKRSLDKNHAISERDARILIATIEAYEKRVAELEEQLKTAAAVRNALEVQS